MGAGAVHALREYFRQNRHAFWSDALIHHGLV
jgi:hypothetical protein